MFEAYSQIIEKSFASCVELLQTVFTIAIIASSLYVGVFLFIKCLPIRFLVGESADVIRQFASKLKILNVRCGLFFSLSLSNYSGIFSSEDKNILFSRCLAL